MYTLILDEAGYLLPVVVIYNNGQLSGSTIEETGKQSLCPNLLALHSYHNNSERLERNLPFCDTSQALHKLSQVTDNQYISAGLEALAESAEQVSHKGHVLEILATLTKELNALATDNAVAWAELSKAVDNVSEYLK